MVEARAATARPAHGASPSAGPRVYGAWALLALLTLAAASLLVVTQRPMMAVLPLVAGVVVLALWHAPLRVPLYVAVGTALLADLLFPTGMALGHPYARAVRVLNWLLLDNLNKLTGIEALRFSGMELVLVIMLGLVLVRRAVSRPSATTLTLPRPLVLALVTSLAVVAAAEVWGIARGGDIRQSLWQFRYLGWLPLLTFVAVQVLQADEALPEIATLVTTVAVLKALLAVFVYVWSVRAGVGRPHSATSHTDTVLFTLVIALWSAQLAFRPSTTRLAVALPIIGTMLLAMIVNNRRTAFVTLPVLLMLLVAHLTRRQRRKLLRGALLLTPVLAVYLVVGLNRNSTLFRPVQMVKSVSMQKDASSDSRDVENANLALTMRQHPVLGSGFGHPYVVGKTVYDLSDVFAQYRFIAHNSVLWLFSLAGPVGGTLLWVPHVLAMFLAGRAFRLATLPYDRLVSYMVMATITAYLLQAWADMGTQTWTGTCLLACAYVAVGHVVRRTGTWPAGQTLFRWHAPLPEAGYAR